MENQKLISHDWRLSEAVYRALHRWPMIIIFCLVGALLGYAASVIWPTTYRTRAEIAVSLNPYRTYSDSQFLALVYPQYTNIDDYKNWQMSQLSAAIFTDEIIQNTLTALRQDDDYWKDVDADSLRKMLRAEWRTAGVWTLLADSPSAKRSNQAVRAWSNNTVSGIKKALFASEQLIQDDEALRPIVEEKAKTAQLIEEYKTTKKSLQDWLVAAPNLPQNEPLPPTERWQTLYLASRVAQFSPSWIGILGEQPAEDALPQAYMEWIRKIIIAIDNEIPFLMQRSDYLEEQRKLLAEERQKQIDASLGLSPNLVIKGLDKSTPETVRPTALLILVGAVAGLLGWAFWVFASLTRQKLRVPLTDTGAHQ